MTHYAAPGWYGKLPSSGDFVKRRFPDTLQRQWSNWFQVGLHHWQTSAEGENAPSRAFLKAPVWNFVVPPMLGTQLIQMGCLTAARDSVGRHYPLCALRYFTPTEWMPSLLARTGDWYHQMGNTLLRAVQDGGTPEQFDQALLSIPLPQPQQDEESSDILAVIGSGEQDSTLSWHLPSQSFDPQFQTSFWWTNQSDGFPLYTHVHSGNFTAQLFSLLFDPAGGAKPGRNGLYPPMFES
ncbi:type VI secretion system-associated protein TagF [Pantoea sp. SJZ147]|uniref:type VI secretion system-associated protein TagF n=1 Tax=Pantoea sp. SJZ147 TaxID=2572896 RepID=UPI0011A32B07|nr:type VI secretion system-associated protein TagF [Pantoea sp. SJZ147]TWD39708.1 type VI secretion system protein ImpM [Pantoea sp. SJZ147]